MNRIWVVAEPGRAGAGSQRSGQGLAGMSAADQHLNQHLNQDLDPDLNWDLNWDLLWELIRAARQIRDITHGRIQVVVPALSCGGPARNLAARTGLDVYAVQGSNRPWDRVEALAAFLGTAGRVQEGDYILLAHSIQGQAVAPALAVRLCATAVSGVTGIRAGHSRLVLTRMVLDNTRVQTVQPQGTTVLTLVPGALGQTKGAGHRAGGAPGRVYDIPPGPALGHQGITILSTAPRSGTDQALASAKIVVAAGRGIGEQKNLNQVRAFARAFPGAALGASRPLVDQGWISHSHQVGMTGATIRPVLYIACGISGSSQHLAGIREAGWVVSINTNPHAPITGHADLNLVCDLMEFIGEYLK